MSQVIQEAAAHGGVTPESLREADRRLRRKIRRRRRLFANPPTWDAIAGLGTIGLGVESVFATVHPFAAGSVAGVASLAAVAASGVTGGWIARNFGRSSRRGKDG
jgi:phage tail tape-measure protein